jgi:Isoprenylcysteine carboxyl methyltransferase (ICMT) family
MDMSNHPTAPRGAPLRPARPKSAVSHGVGIVGMLGLLSWMAVARYYGMDGPYSALMNVAACGVPMLLWSLLVDKVHRNPSTGIDWSVRKPMSETVDISVTKLAGLWATWFVIGALYCICRWYWSGAYLFSMQMLGAVAPVLFILSIPYVFWLDRYLKDPKDGAWHFGQWLMGQQGWDAGEIAHHARGWAVKGFFTAFMLSIVPGGFGDVVRMPVAEIIRSPVTLAGWMISFMFVIDVAFATVGYALTLKPLDAHIRTANPYLAGWLAALICYPPFTLMSGPLDYHVNTREWSYWMEGNVPLLWITGTILVVLTAIYAWATVAFGLRFSNLTHRGVLTHGPYAWTKHPAYMSKNAFWWISTLPFLVTSHNYVDMIRNTVMIAAVSGVYYWRAKTEEKHLMPDPAYQAYAAWMDEHGAITSRLNRLFRRGKTAEVESVTAD